jgi:hypothetical protein
VANATTALATADALPALEVLVFARWAIARSLLVARR